MPLSVPMLAQRAVIAGSIPGAQANSLWNATTLAAVIGAASAMIVMLIRDGGLEWLKVRRAKNRSDAEIFQKYIGPLADACAKLMWRCKEVFVDDRHAFLKLSTLPTGYNSYKRLSTLYRIASLIGLVRGMDLELSSLAAHNPGYAPPIAKQIAAFCSALADGPAVERDRLIQLCRIWSISIDGVVESRLAAIEARTEVKLHGLLSEQLSDIDNLSSLDRNSQGWLVEQLSRFVAAELGAERPSQDLVFKGREEAISSLSYREALIFREWQDAIGDAVIDRDPDSPRKFRIIGFAGFVDLIASSPHLWFMTFSTSLDDIDFENPNRRDFRAHQLRNIANAAGAMLLAINGFAKPSPFNEETITAARQLVEVTRERDNNVQL